MTLLWADCSLTCPSALFSPAGETDGENGVKIPPLINSTILFPRTRKKRCAVFFKEQGKSVCFFIELYTSPLALPSAAVSDTLLKGRVPQDGYFSEVLQKWALSGYWVMTFRIFFSDLTLSYL